MFLNVFLKWSCPSCHLELINKKSNENKKQIHFYEFSNEKYNNK